VAEEDDDNSRGMENNDNEYNNKGLFINLLFIDL